MHTNSTPNYNLPQFVSTDKPTWLGDVNGAMSAIDTAIAGVNSTATGADSKADNAVTTANTAAGTASDAATLAETANTNATSALTTAGNAATAASAAQSTAEAASTAATAAQGAVSTLSGNVGDLTDLTTTAKNTIVAAINEVNAKPAGATDAEDVTYANTTSGLVATNVQAAIDELAAGITPPVTPYSWVGSLATWTGGMTLAATSGLTESTTEMSAAIGDKCKLYVNGSLNHSADNSYCTVSIKPHGATNWITAFNCSGTAGSATQTFDDAVDLTTYAGQTLDIKLRAYITAGTATATFNRVDINNTEA